MVFDLCIFLWFRQDEFSTWETNIRYEGLLFLPEETIWSNNGFVSNKHAVFVSQDINWWTGVVWIIVMFLSAVWTLILTAPIHCRASIAEQVMQCYISPKLFPRRKNSSTLDGLRVSTFSVIFSLSFFKYILSKDANLLRILEWKEMLLLDAGSITI